MSTLSRRLRRLQGSIPRTFTLALLSMLLQHSAIAQGVAHYVPFPVVSDQRAVVSLLNTGLNPVEVTLRARAADGTLMSAEGVENPQLITVGGREPQSVDLGVRFGVAPGTPGWVEVSPASDLLKATFGLAFAGGGIVAEALTPAGPASELVFADLGADADLYIANVAPDTLGYLSLRLLGTDGVLLRALTLGLTPGASWSARIGELLPDLGEQRIYAIAYASGNPFSPPRNALVGMAIENAGGSTVATPATPASGASTVGYLAHGVQGGGYRTEFQIVNPSVQARTVEFTALGIGMSPAVVLREIPAWGALTEDLASMFGILDDGPIVAGAFRFEAVNGGRVIGQAELRIGSEREVVPLSGSESSDLWFIDANPVGTTPSGQSWIGLALLNPYDLPVIAAIDAVAADRGVLSAGIVHLGPGEHRAFLLDNVITPIGTQPVAVHVTASRPLHGLGLWGTSTLSDLIRLAATGVALDPQASGGLITPETGAWVESLDRASAVGFLPLGFAGAFDATVTGVDPGVLPNPADGTIAAAVEIGPAGAVFEAPFKVALGLSAAFAPGERVVLWRLAPSGVYESIGTTGVTDQWGRVLVADITRSGTYVVVLDAEREIAISQVAPVVGEPGTLITIEGAGFLPASPVLPPFGQSPSLELRFAGPEWTSVAAVIEAVADDEITARVPEGASPGPMTLRIGYRSSNGVRFAVPDPVPVPVVSGLEPDGVLSGATNVDVTVRGSGFTAASIVEYDGAPVLTTFVDRSRLRFVPEGGEPTAGRHRVAVRNPAPGGSSSDLYFLVVLPDLPAQVVTTPEDTPVSITLMTPQVDGAVHFSVVSPPSNGALGPVGPIACTAVACTATVTYSPDTDFSGTDEFTFGVGNGVVLVDGIVRIAVDPVNDAPSAADDTFPDIDEAGAAALDVLANDSDVEGDPLTIVAVGAPICGVVANNGDSLQYTANGVAADCMEAFTYSVGDGSGAISSATVTFTVINLNASPTAVDDAPMTNEETPVTFDPRANDNDPDLDPLTITSVTAPAAGGVVINGGISVTYTPNLDFNGADSFTYTIDDGSGGTDTATVAVTVANLPDPPVGVADAGATDQNTPVVVSVLANDTDPDIPTPGDTLSVLSVTNGASGTAVISGGGTSVTYTPGVGAQALAAGGVLADSFTYVVQDAAGAQSAPTTVSVTITGLNDPPMAVNESFDALGNTALEVAAAASISPGVFVVGSVTANDLDLDVADTLTATPIVAGSSTNGGVLDLAADGTFSYTPPPGFTGADTFGYTVNDGNLGSDTGTVTVNVSAVVWYVDNAAAGGGNGTSTSRFNTLGAAEAASGAGDTIYVFEGDGGNTGQDAGITLQDNQRLVGSGVSLTTGGTFNGVVDQQLIAAGNRPTISNAVGNAVTAINVNVGVRGLTLTGISGLTVAKNDAGTMDLTIADNVITGTGTAFSAATGAAAGSLNVRFDRNTGLSGAGGPAVDIDGSAGGTLNITGFADNTISGATAGTGVAMTSAVFDADPADADFTGDQVTAGATVVGDAVVPDPTGGSGIVLTNVAGDLAFTGLTVRSGGSGLQASGTAGFNAAAGTGFRLTTPASGTIVTTGGPALDLTTLDAAVSLASTSTTGSASTGVSLSGLGGTIAIGTGAISDPAGTGFAVLGGDASVSYGGTISKTAAGLAVDIQNRSGGSATFGGAITQTGGSGISILGAASASNVTFSGPVTLGTLAGRNTGGLTVNNNGQATTVAFTSGLDVATTAATGIDASNGGALNLSAGTLDTVGAGASGLVLNGISSGVSVTSAIVNATTANGIGLTNVTGTTTFGSLLVVNTGGAGIAAANAGTLSISNGSVATTTGPAVSIAGTTMAGAGFTTVSSTGSPTTGIDLTSVSGTLPMAGGSVGTASGTAFNLSGGSAAISYGGSITNTAGRAVSITSLTGGTVALSGAINDSGTGILVQNNTGGTLTFSNATKTVNTGASPAVQLLTNAGATIEFTGGGLDIDTTTGVGFTATGGGTVTVVGAGNSINSTGATALNMNGVTVGANKATFQSISSAGSANGITLDTVTNAQADGIQVTGTGTTDGSGGTISNKTARGIAVLSTNNVTFKNMTFTSASTADGGGTCDNLGDNSGCNAAIHLDTVDTAVLDNVDISGTTAQYAINGRNVADFALRSSTATACGDEVNEGCLRLVNTTGTSQILNSNLSFPSERAAQVENTTGTLALTVDNSTFRDTQSSGLGADGLEMLIRGTSNVTVDVVNSSFLRNRTNGLQVLVEDAGIGSVDVTGSTFDRGAGIGIGMDLSASDTGQITYNVIGNPLINSNGGPAFNSFADQNATVRGRVNNNTVQVGGINTSGTGIRMNSNDSADMIVEVSGNTVGNIGFDIGIDALARGLTGGACGTTCTAGRLDATISNNNVTLVDVLGLYDIRTQAQDSNTVCANLTNNTTSFSGIVSYRARTVVAASTLLLEGFNTNATITWNNNGNTPANAVSDSQNGTLAGATCRAVSHPLP